MTNLTEQEIEKYKLISKIEAESDTQKLTRRLNCDYCFINKKLNELSLKKLKRLAEAKYLKFKGYFE